jgi:hypothetical protein
MPSARVEAPPARVDAPPAQVETVKAVRRPRPALSPQAVRLLAVVPVLAYATCMAIQPLPSGPPPVLPWWYAAVDVASLAALVTACLALGRARWWAPMAVVANGVGMIAETVTCPASGHHQVLGWWWYAQLTLSAAVLIGGLALRRVYRRSR